MTRLAFGLDDWEDRPFRGEAPLTQALVDDEADTFTQRPAVGLPAARRHPRPAPDGPAVLRLHRRRHRPLHDRRRRSARSCSPAASSTLEQNPSGGRVHEPADHLHPRHRAGDGAGQRGRQRGPAAAVHRQPAAGLDAPAPRTITEPRIYFGERPSGVRRHRRPPDTSSTTRPARAMRPARPGPRRAGRATTGINARHDPDAAALRRPVPRPGPAHQRPGHGREPAAVPPLARATG